MPLHPATQCVHAGSDTEPTTTGVATPLITSTSFRYPNADDQVVYPRYFNTSTQRVVARKIADLERGPAGLVLGSGMAAITAVLLGRLGQGDHAIFHAGIYGGARSFVTQRLPSYGIDYTFADGCDVPCFERLIQPNSKLIFFESPTNPLLQILDIQKIATLANEHGILTVLDNTFATPMNQQPLELGVDVVVHSGTKYLNGHSDVNCGAVVTRQEWMDQFLSLAVDLGATLDVRGCYLLERGLKTLALRVERQNHNAARLADALAQHPRVRHVNYPGRVDHPGHAVAARQMTGFGGMLSFELDTDPPTAKAMMQKLQIGSLAVSLGGVETLVCFPSETSHAKLSDAERRQAGISDTLVRVSAGIEDISDLLADFDQALR